jgi:hypothetical protein
MFRTSLTLAFLIASGTAMPSADIASDNGIQRHGPTTTEHAARTTEDHLRSQLDWRSYYLDRAGIRHGRQSQFTGSWRQAPAAPR